MRIGFSLPNSAKPVTGISALSTQSAVTAADSLRAASARLVIRHSTLQKRLTQAEKLLGWDVTTPLGKLRAQLALALYRLAASRA
jgi:hypothetical protein